MGEIVEYNENTFLDLQEDPMKKVNFEGRCAPSSFPK